MYLFSDDYALQVPPVFGLFKAGRLEARGLLRLKMREELCWITRGGGAREPHGQRHARTGPEERGVGRIYSGLGMDILFTTHEEIGTEYRQNCWYREDKEVTIVYISPSGLPPQSRVPETRDESRVFTFVCSSGAGSTATGTHSPLLRPSNVRLAGNPPQDGGRHRTNSTHFQPRDVQRNV
ncbi:hypothetical protein POX_f07734 [Penicillium oxalicum]|uniref:hypothetical protein n=1 Tax=Penicillium oxalicum TaxID=69781 RepID=UPI0020B6F93C|nr:hypothetical protein POX_f07734 [Penicillium oxalicum]KAI2787370.1 hypothetical protein POX_f07734 [Penicillium oxalicum]